MKPSETLRIMRKKIETVPAHFIDLEYYRSNGPGRWVRFRSATECGTHGCVIGWAATTPELAPLESERCPGEPVPEGTYGTDLLNWRTYVQRILSLNMATHWFVEPLYRALFHAEAYDAKLRPGERKAEILRRLRIGERLLIEANEDVSGTRDKVAEEVLSNIPESVERFYSVPVYPDPRALLALALAALIGVPLIILVLILLL